MSLWWFNTFFAALKSLKELAYISRALSVLDFMCAQGREEDGGMHATDVGQPTESDWWQNSDETQQMSGISVMALLLRRAQQPKICLKSPPVCQVLFPALYLFRNMSFAPIFGNVCAAEDYTRLETHGHSFVFWWPLWALPALLSEGRLRSLRHIVSSALWSGKQHLQNLLFIKCNQYII